MTSRILTIPADRVPLYARAIASIAAEIYSEAPRGDEAHVRNVLAAAAADSASLLLAVEVSDPAAAGTETSPSGYAEAAFLLTLPWYDPLTGDRGAWLRILYTHPAWRHRKFASALLGRAEDVLRSRGIKALRADPVYGDDAVVGIFERREYERARMWLRRDL